MRIKFVLVCLVLSIGCASKHSYNKESDSKFTGLLSKFDSLKLPFTVIGLDLVNYTEKAWQERVDSTLLVPNPILKLVDDSELDFIKGKYSEIHSFRFYGVYKMKITDYYLAVMMQQNLQKDEYWLKLNTFNFEGALLDTLTFAGQKVAHYNKYGRISPDLHITTLSYHDIEEDTANLKNYYATEVRNEYTISKEGRFTLVKSKRERGHFTNYGEDNVVSRVDTIEGKYRY